MRRAITTVLITAPTLIPIISALQVTPGSSCASVCLDSETGNALDPAVSTTNTSDIVCYDVDYYSTTVGVKFKNCLECLQNSTDASGSESDVSWFLYNLRYASAVCLYDYPALQANKSETCDLSTACQPLQGAIETGLDLNSDSGEFAYCSADDSVFYGTGIDDCVSCLQSSPDSYLANFLIALQAGCQQQPAAGTLLGLSGELFSGYPMNITSLASNSSTTTTRSTQKEVLSVGAVVGIVIGAAALLILAILLFYIYWRRQQKFYKEEVAMVHPSVFYGKDRGSGSYMTSLTSGNSTKLVPIYTTDHRVPPPSYAPAGSHGLGMDYTNNAEYYDRMEDRNRGKPIMGMRHQLHNAEINSANHVDVAALPTHPAYIARGHSRLGSRASRNSSPNIKSEPRYNRPDSYAAQMYINSLEDARDPAQPRPAPQEPKPDGTGRGVVSSRETSMRNIQVELAGPPDAPVPRQDERTTPIPFHAFGGRGTPAPAPVSSGASSPENGSVSRMPSLILPSVPRIRVPGRKPPRLTITSASPEAISGPLAFPDSRFTQRAGDRIVEQTVDRGDTVEVPIGSGKSYLYG
ncbi:hypothetical protein VP1G_04125 [Cytospora mali]|uniref:Uncharacterized protein n=1 Tax=Cytospora mali TaxID=578113 RepID=A0A194UYU8_CYTMA|nr:hypothetical protein VP1G_04125 [Valsa mali var. pyri (nom. inval.)]